MDRRRDAHIKRAAEIIRGNLRLQVFLPLLVLALATTWYGLGPSLEHFVALTGARFVDMQPTLTPAALIEQVRGYPPETARYYLGWSVFDYAWPFLTFTTMLFMAAWLMRFLPTRWQATFPALVACAYATVLMDWGENAGFVAVMLSESAEPTAIAWLAVLMHRGKLFCNFAFNAGFLVLLLAAAYSRLRNRVS